MRRSLLVLLSLSIAVSSRAVAEDGVGVFGAYTFEQPAFSDTSACPPAIT